MRFPEFSGKWEKFRVSDFIEFFPTNSLSWDQLEYRGAGLLNLHYGMIHNGLPVQVDASKDALPSIKEDLYPKKYTLCKEGDIAFADASEDTNDVGKAIEFNNCAGKSIVCGLHTIHGRDRLGLTSIGFKGYLFSSKVYHDQIKSIAQGTKVFSIKASNFDEVILGLPKIEEQKKISSLLIAIDDRILTQTKIIEELTTLRSALHQGIMSKGLEDGSWRIQTLADVLSERTELNIDGHAVHSVSVSKGIVNQIEYLGRSFAAKDTSRYHVAYPGDVIYTKSPTGEFPYGIVKQSQISIKAALSPLYGVYVPISPEIGYIIHNHFLSAKNALNYLHPLIQKGAKNTINITNQRFLQNSMPLPINKNAALLYYNAIKTVSDKIILEEMVMEKFQSQKSFLLKTMFI